MPPRAKPGTMPPSRAPKRPVSQPLAPKPPVPPISPSAEMPRPPTWPSTEAPGWLVEVVLCELVG